MAKAKPAAAKKAMTKSAFLTHLAEATEMKKSDVATLYEAMVEVVTKELKKTNVFTLPDIARLKLKHVKAIKGGEKKFMPATGKEYTTQAKPAHNKVRAFPVKKLKDAVA